VTGAVYLEMLEKFLTSIFEEQGPNDFLFKPDGVPPRFDIAVAIILGGKFQRKWIGTGGCLLSLTYHHLTPFSGGT
jgi:hypothetical protein